MTEPPFPFRAAFAIFAGAAALVVVAGWVPTWVLWAGGLWLLAGVLAVVAWASWRARRHDEEAARIAQDAARVRAKAEVARLRLDAVEAILDAHGQHNLELLRREAEGEALDPWAIEVSTASSGAVHVVPVDDLVAHDLTGDACPCGPDVAWVDDDGSSFEVPVVTHHALDGRP